MVVLEMAFPYSNQEMVVQDSRFPGAAELTIGQVNFVSLSF